MGYRLLEQSSPQLQRLQLDSAMTVPVNRTKLNFVNFMVIEVKSHTGQGGPHSKPVILASVA